MSWFDKLQANLQDAATKAGITPAKLKEVGDTLNRELAKLPDHAKALKVAAEQHGIEVDKIQEALDHAGAQMTKVVDGIASDISKSTSNPPPPKP